MTQKTPRHNLSNKNLEAKSADCSVCGPGVALRINKRPSGEVYGVCNNRRRATKRKNNRDDPSWVRPVTGPRVGPHGLTAKEAREFIGDESCAICKRKYRMKADHCHETGKLREPLCHYCNFGLGHFFDSPELLREAADYIERHRDS